MFKSKKVLSVLVLCVFTVFCVGIQTKTASANIWPSSGSLDLIKSSCTSGADQYSELVQLKKEIATADTIDQARTIALAPTDEAIDSLKNARMFMPMSDELFKAETRLSDARSRILVASSQAQVADEFSGMMLAGLDNDRAAHLGVGKVGCDYSTGEVIAIVLGLILGIIPGLILLVVLC
ncbi:MAG: hypothetical protein WCL60_05935 [Methylococcales bacterium]